MAIAGLKALDNITGWLGPWFNPKARKEKAKDELRDIKAAITELENDKPTPKNRVRIGDLSRRAIKLRKKIRQLGG